MLHEDNDDDVSVENIPEEHQQHIDALLDNISDVSISSDYTEDIEKQTNLEIIPENDDEIAQIGNFEQRLQEQIEEAKSPEHQSKSHKDR
eukprot:UN15818